MESAKNTANVAHDKAANAANANPGTTQQQKEDSSGWVQQVIILAQFGCSNLVLVMVNIIRFSRSPLIYTCRETIPMLNKL